MYLISHENVDDLYVRNDFVIDVTFSKITRKSVSRKRSRKIKLIQTSRK